MYVRGLGRGGGGFAVMDPSIDLRIVPSHTSVVSAIPPHVLTVVHDFPLQSKEEAFLVKKIQENACFVISKSYW